MKILYKITIIGLFLFIMTSLSLHAQVSINSNGELPDNSAMLDVKSANKGFLPPRVELTATTSAAPVTSPAIGLLLFNTATSGTPPDNVVPGYYYWNGTLWVPIAAPQGTNPGDMLYWNGLQWLPLPLGSPGQFLQLSLLNVPTWSGAAYSTLTTTAASSITTTTSTSGGNITNDGGTAVTARGVCWSTSSNPIATGNHTTDGSGTGVFESNLTDLMENTLYFIRAYATNSVGTSYGNELSFKTLTLPAVTTSAVTNITPTSSTCGGTVTFDGNTSETVRGVCWSTTPNPTIANSYTTNGSGTGVFTSNLTGLSPNTLYYTRAYAANSVGIAYGNELNFTTLWVCGASFTINHVAGSIAPVTKTVTYGTVNNIPGEPLKCWISQNLGADHQATAYDDATEASAGWYWQFNLKQGYKIEGDREGTIRTPNTAWIGSISENSDWIASNDPCTLELGNGWRIPTSTEWANVDASGNWLNREDSWNSNLKLHPPGYLPEYDGGRIRYRGYSGGYSSSTQTSTSNRWHLGIDYGNCFVANEMKANGFSLRCIKD